MRVLANCGVCTKPSRARSHTLSRSWGRRLKLSLKNPLDWCARVQCDDGVGQLPGSIQPAAAAGEVIAKFENNLLFPLHDRLLGGPGEPVEQMRELTEIDEELFRSVTQLIPAQLERAWKASTVSVTPLVRKASLDRELFAMEERVVTLQFEIRLATAVSAFSVASPMSFSSGLVRSNGDARQRNEIHANARLRFANESSSVICRCQLTWRS